MMKKSKHGRQCTVECPNYDQFIRKRRVRSLADSLTGPESPDIIWIYCVYPRDKEGEVVEVQVREWGNSQGIRFPKAVLQEAGIEINDKLTLKVEDGKIILFKTFRHRTLEERIRDSGCELSGIGELDWGEAQGNEVW